MYSLRLMGCGARAAPLMCRIHTLVLRSQEEITRGHVSDPGARAACSECSDVNAVHMCEINMTVKHTPWYAL